MAPKNKIILKKTLLALIPIIFLVGLSCFFFINFDPSEWSSEQWKNSIISGVVGYGGTTLLSLKTIMFGFDVVNRVVKSIKNKSNATTLPTDKQATITPKNKRNGSKDSGDSKPPIKVMGY